MLRCMIEALKETLCRIACGRDRVKKGMNRNDETDEYDGLPLG